MKRTLVVTLTDEELLDVYHAILDRDADEALQFLDEHLKKEIRHALEGG